MNAAWLILHLCNEEDIVKEFLKKGLLSRLPLNILECDDEELRLKSVGLIALIVNQVTKNKQFFVCKYQDVQHLGPKNVVRDDEIIKFRDELCDNINQILLSIRNAVLQPEEKPFDSINGILDGVFELDIKILIMKILANAFEIDEIFSETSKLFALYHSCPRIPKVSPNLS